LKQIGLFKLYFISYKLAKIKLINSQYISQYANFYLYLYHILAMMRKFGLTKSTAEILNELAQKHKVLRKQAGFTQSELAQRSGVSLGSIKRFENTGQISLESLVKCAQILDRTADFDLLLNANDNLKAIEKLFSDKTRF